MPALYVLSGSIAEAPRQEMDGAMIGRFLAATRSPSCAMYGSFWTESLWSETQTTTSLLAIQLEPSGANRSTAVWFGSTSASVLLVPVSNVL